jgi:hypothetical protein
MSVVTAFSEQKLADAENENENENEAALVAQGLALDQVAADRINKHTMGFFSFSKFEALLMLTLRRFFFFLVLFLELISL